MITTKELQYVDAWAAKTPMPGIEYSLETLEYIKKCVESFNEKYKNKEYNIIFSNGDEIELEILDKNLCHMLGIDYNNIKNDYFSMYRKKVFGTSNDNFTSYNLLELIIENAEKIAEMDNNPTNKAKAINYYKSRIKCEIFDKLCDFSSFNYGAINFVGNKEEVEYDKQKTLFIPSNEPICPYFMMHIKMEDENKTYIPASTLAPLNPKSFFENQEVIIPTQILITDEERLIKKTATASEKIKLLTLYKSIINEYQIPNNINIYGDYESLLNDMTREQKKVNTKTL